MRRNLYDIKSGMDTTSDIIGLLNDFYRMQNLKRCRLVSIEDVLEQMYDVDCRLVIGNCGHIGMYLVKRSLGIIFLGSVCTANIPVWCLDCRRTRQLKKGLVQTSNW